MMYFLTNQDKILSMEIRLRKETLTQCWELISDLLQTVPIIPIMSFMEKTQPLITHCIKLSYLLAFLHFAFLFF